MNIQEMKTKMVEYFSSPDFTEFAYADFVCRYRTFAGAKCAVGCLIPDEAYDPAAGGSIRSLFWGSGNERRLLRKKNPALFDMLDNAGIPLDTPTLEELSKIQSAHDALAVKVARETQGFEAAKQEFLEYLETA